MKSRILGLSLFALLAVAPVSSALAYFGFNYGLTNNSNFGYGLNFGFYTPDNFGLDFNILSDREDKSQFTRYWFQESISLFYDFNQMLKNFSNQRETGAHPYAKLGFTYGNAALTSINVSGTQYGARVNQGPGLSFGVGCDWKWNPAMSLGLDLFESILWLSGSNVGGTQITPDEVHYGFNLLFSLRVYDFL